MPSISYDGQSFLIDGRRVWIVSGAIHYARVPRGLWHSRIRAAKQAGLNCVQTDVFWNRHEPKPGVFDFTGEADLRHFLRLVAQEGMHCILRPGPYLGAQWDFGGLPPWLLRREGLRLRQANPVFLESCARYLGAVMEQVQDLQITSVTPPAPWQVHGGGGPIIMMQAENQWFCHNPVQADTYLRELVRYLRENGCEVPITCCSNLWQRTEGTIDTWNASDHLAADLRQLRAVCPDAPRLVTEFRPGGWDRWDAVHAGDCDADGILSRLASALAVGAQYNLYMFHGGTNFGFYAGRGLAAADAFGTTSHDGAAPLLEAGGRGGKYLAVKRISTFASQFASLLGHLQSGSAPTAVAVADNGTHPPSVMHQDGTQGKLVFLFQGKDDPAPQIDLLLPNGLTLPVPMGDERVAWLVLDANLAGLATLTYTNLRPWAFLGRHLLVLFGPAGAQGLVCIDGALREVQVPTGQVPTVVTHQDLILAVLSTQQIDAAYVAGADLIVGAAGLDDHDQPLPLKGWPHACRVDPHGHVTRLPMTPPRLPVNPHLGAWQSAGVDDLVSGASESFAPIDGPRSLEDLGCDYGYGWYRLGAVAHAPGQVLFPQSGDRLHVFTRGRRAALLGLGPGAQFDPASLTLGDPTVILADNLGRLSCGWRLGESKGLWGHVYTLKPLALGKPKVVSGRAPDPFTLSGYWDQLRVGDHRSADALIWSVSVPAAGPGVLDICDLPLRCMVQVNGRSLDMYDPTLSAHHLRLVVPLKRGRNEIKLALTRALPPKTDAGKFLRLYQTVQNLSAKAQWSFAPWTIPAAAAFQPAGAPGAGAGTGGKTGAGTPRWFRTQFQVRPTQVPLWLEPRGLTKGQIILNGHNIGRYFVATPAGQPVPPQTRYYLPEPWLHTDQPNDLLLFDEHGRSPRSCRLVYDALGPHPRGN
jgi:hypothetical protein